MESVVKVIQPQGRGRNAEKATMKAQMQSPYLTLTLEQDIKKAL
jgi:hypothetical protein